MWVAVAVVLASGCGRFAFAPTDDAMATADTAPASCASWSPFGAATNVAPLNSAAHEASPSLTSDGLALYFSSYRGGDGQDVYRSTRTAIGQPWATATLVVELQLPGDAEGNAEISGDELELFYGENRVERSVRNDRSEPWPPVTIHIAPMAGVFAQPQGLDLSRDGLTAYFTANRTATANDVFVATRADAASPFGNFEPVTPLVTEVGEGFPTLSADGLEMFYTSSALGTDINYARRPPGSTNADWVPYGVVAELDVSAPQADAELSADGTELYFISQRPGGAGNYDVWFATRTCLD